MGRPRVKINLELLIFFFHVGRRVKYKRNIRHKFLDNNVNRPDFIRRLEFNGAFGVHYKNVRKRFYLHRVGTNPIQTP